MKFVLTARFAKAYKRLPDALKPKVDKCLRLLAGNPRHPSLQFKKIQGTDNIWEARVDRGCRITLEVHTEYYLLRNVGKHDETLDNP